MAKSAVNKAAKKSNSRASNSRFGSRKKDAWDELGPVEPGTGMGDYLRRFWQPVAVSKDVQPGKAIPIRIMGEDLTLYRGETGTPHIVAHRCAHRSTVLHIGWVEGDCIRCRYHGWKYDGEGQCVEMPAEDPSFPPKVKILHYPAIDYGLLVFAYMGEGDPPEIPRKTELNRDFGVQWATTQAWPCGWFQRIENSMDSVHINFVHRNSGFGETLSTELPDLEYAETDWGIRTIATRSPTNVCIAEFHLSNCNHVVVPTQMPGQSRGKTLPWTDLFNWFVPVDDEHTALFTSRSAPIDGEAAEEFETWLDRADRYNPADHHDALFRGEMPAEDVGDSATGLVQAQDYVTQIGQGTVVDRSQEWLGRSDEGVILMRKIFRREINAMRKGLPIKVWQHKPGFARLPVPPDVPPSPDPEPLDDPSANLSG